jgi:hypothetical protein
VVDLEADLAGALPDGGCGTVPVGRSKLTPRSLKFTTPILVKLVWADPDSPHTRCPMT